MNAVHVICNVRWCIANHFLWSCVCDMDHESAIKYHYYYYYFSLLFFDAHSAASTHSPRTSRPEVRRDKVDTVDRAFYFHSWASPSSLVRVSSANACVSNKFQQKSSPQRQLPGKFFISTNRWCILQRSAKDHQVFRQNFITEMICPLTPVWIFHRSRE